MSIYDGMLILTEEPFTGYMPADVRTLLKEQIPDAQLARAFACVHNHATSLLCNLDEGDQWMEYAFWEWQEILEELIDQICAILESENSLHPLVRKHAEVHPFMKRNGFHCPSGWWIRMDSVQEDEA